MVSDLTVTDRELLLSNLQIDGGAKGRVEILADLALEKPNVRGLLFARWAKLSAAVRLGGSDRDWKLTKSRKWFEAERELDRSSSRAVESASERP